MTARASLSGRQRTEGTPITLNGGLWFDQAGWAAMNDRGFGVKTSGATPTNISDFAHTVGPGSAAMTSFTQNERVFYAGASQTSDNVASTFRALVPLDANFVAGRSVFAFSADGTGAILAASSAYLIR